MALLDNNRSENLIQHGVEGGELLTPDLANMSPDALEALASQKRQQIAEKLKKVPAVSGSETQFVAIRETSLSKPSETESPLVVKAKQALNAFFQHHKSFEDTKIDEGNAASIVAALEDIESQKPQ
jgi:hypothetical protein